MLEQTFITGVILFVVFVVCQFVMKKYNEHIKRLDQSNESLSQIAKNINEITNEKNQRYKELAKRKNQADIKRAYEKGKREAMEASSNVTQLRPKQDYNDNNYEAFKNGEAPAQYDRSQGFD